MAGRVIRQNNRPSVGRVRRDGVMRTRLEAVTAFGTAFDEQGLGHRAWRAKPVFAWPRHGLVGRRITVRHVFLSRLRDGDERVLQKMSTPVLRLTSHGS
jgi:hypothetical protein